MGIDTGMDKGTEPLGGTHAGRLKRDLGRAQEPDSSDSGGSESPEGSDAPDSSDDPGTSDGRRLRRSRNRETVVDALLALYSEGNLDPSAADVAERSGLSPRSLFRYFTDVDDLARAAIDRQYALLRPMAEVDLHLGAPLDVRVDELVERRVNVFEIVGKVGLVARLRAPFEMVIAEQLTRIRSEFRAQIELMFSEELKALGATRGPQALAAIDTLCTFEAYHLWRGDQGLDMREITALMTGSILALLGQPSN